MTSTYSQKAVDLLQPELGNDYLGLSEFRGEKIVRVAPNSIVRACKFLRDLDVLKFDLLNLLTAVDYWPGEPRFAVDYRLVSMKTYEWIGLRVLLDSTSAEVETVETIFPSANWHEREIYDMYGIQFIGHSDLRRILMPEDWVGHPLRKDYPLGYEEVQFTFNFDDIDDKKSYAND